jgi:general stress protein YciG
MIKLYVKTHKDTGLKYLGKTEQVDHDKYRGSGDRWLNHLKEHGNNVSTEIVYQSEDIEDIRKMGLELSAKWDIVASNEWANIKPEEGDGGFGWMTKEYRLKNAKRAGDIRAEQMKRDNSNPFSGKRAGLNFADNPEFQKECARKGTEALKTWAKENPEKELERRRKIGEANKNRPTPKWSKERREAHSKLFKKPLEELMPSTRMKRDPEFKKDMEDLKEAYYNQNEPERKRLYEKLRACHKKWA